MNEEVRKAVQNQEEVVRQKDNEISQILEKMNEMKNEIESLRESNDERLRAQSVEFTNMSTMFREQVRQLTDQVAQQNGLIDSLKEEVDDMRLQPSLTCQFLNESNPSGVISQLGSAVSLSAGGGQNSSNLITNITKYDNSYFYNYSGYKTSSESDSFIIFDFGPTKKIDLWSYFIRSNGCQPNDYHPKTWRVEGSNDKSQWTALDRRVDDPNLNGPHKQCNFSCQTAAHGIKSSRFRYIRYVQESNWYSSNPYNVYITYFELYGNVYN